jgi:hypothetical protein
MSYVLNVRTVPSRGNSGIGNFPLSEQLLAEPLRDAESAAAFLEADGAQLVAHNLNSTIALRLTTAS